MLFRSCPKSIPTKSKSSPQAGTAGFLFYQNKNGFNFKSVDSLMSGFHPDSADKKTIFKYVYKARTNNIADPNSNFKVLSVPVFEKNVDIMENLRIGMYSSRNYFFDVNARKFYEYKYTLKESYKYMGNASKSNTTPPVPLGLDETPSRLMLRVLDNFNADPAFDPLSESSYTGKFIRNFISSPAAVNTTINNEDKSPLYQAASIARYNLAFSQRLNITVPLNLNLTVEDVIELEIGRAHV